MKILPFVCFAVSAACSAHAAVSYSGVDGFTALNQTNIAVVDDVLEFGHPNVFPNPSDQRGQGAGVTLDVGGPNVLDSNLSSFLLDSNGSPIPDASLFFQFSFIVPSPTSASDELGFFLGPPANQAQSSDITNGQNTNAFTLFIDDQGLYAQNNGQISNNRNSVSDGTNGSSLILETLGVNTEITVTVEWSLVNGANNGLASVYTVTANGFDEANNAITGTGMFDGAQQNLSATTIDKYAFTASTTRSQVGSLTGFAVADGPISVPEPSSILLSLLGFSAFISHRRRLT